MKQSTYLSIIFYIATSGIYGAQKQVHRLAQEQETARKRQKTEGAEIAIAPMDTSYVAPIIPAQTTTSSSSCAVQPMEDIDEKLKSETQQRSSAQQEFFDMFYQLAWNSGYIDLNKLEKLLQNPSALPLEEIIDPDEHQTALLIVSRAHGITTETRFKAMQLLLKAGANANARDRYGMTPLLRIAKKQKERHEDFINLLLQHDADITARSNNGKSIIDLLDLPHLALNLLAIDAPLPQLNEWKSKELFIYAIQENNVPAVLKFTQGGMNVNFKFQGTTPLMYAVTSNNIKIVQALLKAGAHVNAQNSENDTALHFINALTRPDIVKLIIKAGANVNLQDSVGQIPLNILMYYIQEDPNDFGDNTYQTIQLLLKGNAQYGPTNLKLIGNTIDNDLNIELDDDETTQKVKRKIQKIILEYRLSPVLQKQAQEHKARRATARAAQRGIENYLEKSEQSEKLGVARDVIQHMTPLHFRTYQEK